MDKLDNYFDLTKSNNINNENVVEIQNNFLEKYFGNAINGAIDIGLKAVLPDIIENEIIDIKDIIMENGFKAGIDEIIKNGIELGKSAQGIITGTFENTNQIELAVKKGGILDKTSKLLDFAINIATSKNLINKTISSLIKNGKNNIISSISNKLEESLTNQLKVVNKIEKYCEKWNESYGNKDIIEMEKAYKNIKNNLDKVIPLENIINKARNIENMHNLIKNKGNDFEINEYEFELLKRL